MSRRQTHREVAAAVGLSLVAALGMGATAEAADFTVSNTSDMGTGSLRKAIMDSDNGTGPDRIIFQAGVVGTIILMTGQLPTIDEPLEVLGPGAGTLTVSANNASRIFFAQNVPGDVTISGLTLTGGNSAGNVGGAIFSDDTPLTIRNSTIAGNTSGDDGGGVWDFGGTVTIQSSTISGNTATDNGGGVRVEGGGTATIQNSTISGNNAVTNGGGISSINSTVTVESSTFSNNGASDGGGIDQVTSATDPTLTNTIVANNTATGTGPDLHGAAADPFNLAFTLYASGSGATINNTVPGSNIPGVDPQLGMLAGNGGPTQTHALPSTSPAVDKGSSTGPTDQRGQPRPFDIPSIANSMAAGGNGADIGAFELQLPQSVPATPTTKKRCKKKKRGKKRAAAAKKRCKKKKKKKR